MKDSTKKINYQGTEVEVRGGAWLDIMNSCFYTVIDTISRYQICRDLEGKIFALPYLNY